MRKSVFSPDNTSDKRWWFTLIELLLVVTIISIIGIASISWFSRISGTQEAETAMKSITHTLDWFDQSVAIYAVTSYETMMKSGSLGFVTNLDSYKKSPPIEYSFDFTTGSGIAKSLNTGTGRWEVIFRAFNAQPQIQSVWASGATKSFLFPQDIGKRLYQISGSIEEVVMNSYVIQYYNPSNRSNVPEKEVRLTGIEGVSLWTKKWYNSLVIRNVLGRKTLQGWSWATLDTLERALLLFDKNGREMNLTVSP